MRPRTGLQPTVVRFVRLVAVPIQGSLDRFFHAFGNRGRATQIAATLLGQTLGQVAGTTLAVHRLAGRSQSKAFFRAFMSFDFGAHRG